MPGIPPPNFKTGQPLTAQQLNQLKDLIFSQIVGDGLIEAHAAGGRLVLRLSSEITRGREIRRTFRTTAVAKDGDNNRWVYIGRRLGSKTGAGYAGTWNDHPTDTASYVLYSLMEFNNGSTGTYGNGVTQANLDAVNDSGGGTDGTHAVQAVPIGTPVRAFLQVRDDGVPEWWIDNLPNGVDGVCPIPA